MSNHDHTPMTDRSGAADSRTLTIIVGRLDPLLSRRLGRSLGIAPHIRVAVQDLDEAALEDAIAHEQPHVAIIGVTVDYDFLAGLQARHPATGLLVIAHDLTLLYGTVLLAVGVTCLAHRACDGDLLAAVDAAARGEPALFWPDGKRLARRYPSDGLLTPRELEVLAHLSHGGSYAQIGRALHIAPETARTHTVRICRKLGVKSKRDLRGMPVRARPLRTD